MDRTKDGEITFNEVCLILGNAPPHPQLPQGKKALSLIPGVGGLSVRSLYILPASAFVPTTGDLSRVSLSVSWMNGWTASFN